MMKLLVLGIMAICLLSCEGNKSADGVVYLCNGASASTFHEDSDCLGLSKCKAEIVEVDVKHAFDIGRKPCRMCCDGQEYSSIKKDIDMSANLGKYVYKDAFSLHTKMDCTSSGTDVEFLDTCTIERSDVQFIKYCTRCFNDAKYEHLQQIVQRNEWQ